MSYTADQITEVFKRFDIDGNNEISTQELSAVIKDICGTEMAEALLTKMIGADTNEDGVIDFGEFVAWLYSGKDGVATTMQKALGRGEAAPTEKREDQEGGKVAAELQREEVTLEQAASNEDEDKTVDSHDSTATICIIRYLIITWHPRQGPCLKEKDKGRGIYYADGTKYGSHGIPFCCSKDMKDTDPFGRILPWGESITGSDAGEGWIQCVIEASQSRWSGECGEEVTKFDLVEESSGKVTGVGSDKYGPIRVSGTHISNCYDLTLTQNLEQSNTWDKTWCEAECCFYPRRPIHRTRQLQLRLSSSGLQLTGEFKGAYDSGDARFSKLPFAARSRRPQFAGLAMGHHLGWLCRLSDVFAERSFTVEAWVKLHIFNRGGQPGMGPLEGSNTILGIRTTNKKTRLGIGESLTVQIRGGSPYIGFYGNDTQAQEKLELKRWYHLAFVYDMERDFVEGKQLIYIDGNRAEETKHTGIIDTPVRVGRQDFIVCLGDSHWGGRFLNGEIALLNIWDHARTPEMVLEGMRAGAPRHGATPEGLFRSLTFHSDDYTSCYVLEAVAGERVALDRECVIEMWDNPL